MVPSLGVKHPNEMEKKVFRGNLRKRCGMTCSERQSYNKYEKYVAPEKVNLKDFFDCPVGNESLFYQHLTVYPVSFNGHLQQEHYQYERLRYISFNSNVSYDFWESQAAAGGYFQDSLTSRVLCFACGRQYGFPHTVNCPRSVESIPFQFFPELPQTSNDIIDLGELNVTLTPTSNEDIVRPFNVRLRQGRRRATAPGPPLSQPSVPGRSAEPLPRRSPRPTPGEDVESAGPRPCPCEKSARIQFPAYMDLDDRIDSFRHHGRLSPFARRLAELGYYAVDRSHVACYACGALVTADDQQSLEQQPAEPRPQPEVDVAPLPTASAVSDTQALSGEPLLWPATTPDLTPPAERPTRRCRVCKNLPAAVLFLPCGHIVCCAQCAVNQRCCPVCRLNVDKKQNIYMS